MEVKEAILSRRSVRKFTPEPVPDEMVHELLRSAMAAPSACNRQPWEFFVVRNPQAQEALRGATPYTKMNSSLILVVAGNSERFLTKKPGDYWIQDCSAAIENILLTAVDLGLGACWCGLYPAELRVEKVRKILGQPENVIPLSLIQLGWPAQTPEPRTQYNESFVHVI